MGVLTNLNLLIVEDETNLGETLHDYLSSKGASCQHAPTAAQARKFFDDEKFKADVVLMDIGLPDGDGISLAREFREKRQDFVLLFLSAQNDPETRFLGLSIGAEDYITKPFDLRELILRLERILRAKVSVESLDDEIQIGDLKIWFKRFELEDATGVRIPLTQKECAILDILYKRKNEVVSRDDIIDEVWGKDQYPSNRTVDNYIVKLRKWCDTDKTEKIKISSIRGIGYKLELK